MSSHASSKEIKRQSLRYYYQRCSHKHRSRRSVEPAADRPKTVNLPTIASAVCHIAASSSQSLVLSQGGKEGRRELSLWKCRYMRIHGHRHARRWWWRNICRTCIHGRLWKHGSCISSVIASRHQCAALLVFAYTYMHTDIPTYVRTYTYTCTYAYAYAYEYAYAYAYTCTSASTCTSTYTYTYTHTPTATGRQTHRPTDRSTDRQRRTDRRRERVRER